MRVMLDTNVLISGFALNSRSIMDMARWITENHQLVLSSYVIDELREVLTRKFPRTLKDLDDFLVRLPYEMCYTPTRIPERWSVEIRDPDDAPVLYSAQVAEVDVLISGDKDFADVCVDRPEILTPGEFIKRYM